MVDLIGMARETADQFGLQPELVCAVVEQESNWEPWATRVEPAFYKKYIQPLIDRGQLTNQTEAYERAVSWGLMQIMGEVAREMGFQGPLPQLCDPATGLRFGCKKLLACMTATGGSVADALSRWNGGGNSNYAPAVLARMEKYVQSPAVSPKSP